jgi:hypothetical protein
MPTTSPRVALAAITAALALTTAAPAQASDAFSPGLSDAAQSQATPRSTGVARTDLRGEAARAAGQAPLPVVVDVHPTSANGLDWGSFGLGAGGAVALAAIATGGVLAAGRRHRTPRQA